jgi:predicted DsbA family dithiol-disulfide isomerase
MYSEMHKKIMGSYTELKNNEHLPLELAGELGLNIEQLKADIKDPALQNQINTEVSELRSTKLRLAVPKFLINGEETNLRALQQKITEILGKKN